MDRPWDDWSSLSIDMASRDSAALEAAYRTLVRTLPALVPELVGNQDEQTDVLTGIPAESEEVRAVAAPWEDEQ